MRTRGRLFCRWGCGLSGWGGTEVEAVVLEAGEFGDVAGEEGELVVGEVELREVVEGGDGSRYFVDEVVLEGEYFDVVLFVNFGEGDEFVHVGVEVLEFGVVAEVDGLERVVVEVEALDAGEEVGVELSDAVGGELYFFAADELHVAEGADIVLAEVQVPQHLYLHLQHPHQLVVLKVQDL